MSTSTPHPDYGIDLTVNDIEVAGRRRFESGYKIDVQAKSATRTNRTAAVIRYNLELTAYDLLRHASLGCPRILVVLLLPPEEARWTSQTDEALILRHCAYWLSLQGHGPTRNRRSVRLSIPRANRFTPEALRAMLTRVKTGEEP
jgi:hypothetical protein